MADLRGPRERRWSVGQGRGLGVLLTPEPGSGLGTFLCLSDTGARMFTLSGEEKGRRCCPPARGPCMGLSAPQIAQKGLAGALQGGVLGPEPGVGAGGPAYVPWACACR